MALTRLNEFDDGTVFTETKIEGEFDRIYTGGPDLAFPLPKNVSAAGFDITSLGEAHFDSEGDASAAGRLRRNGVNLTWHDGSAAGRIFYAGGTDVPVADGGTGASTFTANSLLLGNGASAISALGAATHGQLPIGNTGSAPTLAALTAGDNMTVTNAAGSITLAANPGTGLSAIDLIIKASPETVNGSDTLQNDDELLAALVANETVVFECFLFMTSGSTPDIKFAFTIPTSAAIIWSPGHSVYLNTSEAAVGSVTTTASGTAASAAGQGGQRLITLVGIVVNSTNAGNLTLQWAQNTSDASNTTIAANSYMIVRRV